MMVPPGEPGIEYRFLKFDTHDKAEEAYSEAIRLITKHRAALDRLAQALLEKETLNRNEIEAVLGDLALESRAAETVGTVRALASEG